MKTDNLLTLPDGRKLAYADFGKPDGNPVLYFHATPSSRLEPLSLGDDVFSQFGLRVICPDRPGMGQSEFQRHRGFSDWAYDMLFLSEALGLHQFSVLGVSGGGGYAAACAAAIPEKLSKVVIVSGAWRMDWPEAVSNLSFPFNLLWQLTNHAPILLPIMLKMMSQPLKNGYDQALAQQKKFFPASDYALFSQPDRMAINQQIMSESLKQGSKGPVWDLRLYVREWDFNLADIQIPLILFHGEQDKNVPLALVQRAANLIPGAELRTYPGEAHLSTLVNHFDEIAKALIPNN